jgi:hypothetical protein
MNGLVHSVRWVWAISVAMQVAVCVILLIKGHIRKLPVFSLFVAANLSQAGLFYFVYTHFGYGSQTALVVGWVSEVCILLLRTLATMEVLQLVLGAYRGIWGLAWRVLSVIVGVILAYSAIEAARKLTWAIVFGNRGYHFAFALALVGCLVLIRYYSIPINVAQKLLLGGFCFYSCTVVLADTVGPWFFVRGSVIYQTIWQLTTTAAYAGIQLAWAVALWKPASEVESPPSLVTTSLYQQISPQINERLHVLNEHLSQFWPPRATRQ